MEIHIFDKGQDEASSKKAQLEFARLQLEIDKGTYVRLLAETYQEVYEKKHPVLYNGFGTRGENIK